MDPIKGYSSIPPEAILNPSKSSTASDGSFAKTLESLISNVDETVKTSDQISEDFALGKPYDLHEIMIAAEKAQLSLKFLVQVRNKLLTAYQELMRMTF